MEIEKSQLLANYKNVFSPILIEKKERADDSNYYIKRVANSGYSSLLNKKRNINFHIPNSNSNQETNNVFCQTILNTKFYNNLQGLGINTSNNKTNTEKTRIRKGNEQSSQRKEIGAFIVNSFKLHSNSSYKKHEVVNRFDLLYSSNKEKEFKNPREINFNSLLFSIKKKKALPQFIDDINEEEEIKETNFGLNEVKQSSTSTTTSASKIGDFNLKIKSNLIN